MKCQWNAARPRKGWNWREGTAANTTVVAQQPKKARKEGKGNVGWATQRRLQQFTAVTTIEKNPPFLLHSPDYI